MGSTGDHLHHLGGMRCLACLWIVCAHYMPRHGDAAFNGVVFRANVAVCFFVVTSGFVTQWSYGSRELSDVRALGQFYLRRLGRILFTFWVALAFACTAVAKLGTEFDVWYLVRCALFLEQWVNWCPNGPSWFVFALLPSWILYPLSRCGVMAVQARSGRRGLVGLLLLLWALSFGPAVLLFVAHGGNITFQEHANMSFWPPSQMADFMIGMVVAVLARDREDAGGKVASDCSDSASSSSTDEDGGSWHAGPLLADACLLLVAGVALLVPKSPGTHELSLSGWEPLLDHGLALAFAGFLYGSCGRSPWRGLGAWLLGNEVLAALGKVSFEVYIFQRPVHDAFRLCFGDEVLESSRLFSGFVLALWLFAALYAHLVQAPVDSCLRAVAVRMVSPAKEEADADACELRWAASSKGPLPA